MPLPAIAAVAGRLLGSKVGQAVVTGAVSSIGDGHGSGDTPWKPQSRPDRYVQPGEAASASPAPGSASSPLPGAGGLLQPNQFINTINRLKPPTDIIQ